MRKLILAAVLAVSFSATAKLTLDTGSTETTFRVDGKTVSAAEAMHAAIAGKTVFKCKPRDAKGNKTFYGENGQALSKVVECTPQDAKINAKTGAVSFKAVKQ